MTRLRKSLAATALALAALPTPQATATSSLPELTCEVAVQLNFAPPLTATSTTAHVTGVATLVNCLSPSGDHTHLKGGAVSDATGTATSLAGVPCSLLITITGRATIVWSPAAGQTTFDFTVNTNPLAGSVQLTTTQTSGPLTGTTSQTVGVPVPNPTCALTGLSGLAVPVGQTTFL
ncbi:MULTISPECIES: hypothetical protein [Actinosynnema]|uniref:hypothetical protein n=1 Tax=Actinosynnema TaxID=40566 RepID=UPI0020A3EF9C|nr:hypothetical protein [Actinosynnema pretiosum]MCP2098798.1 hypothetical protein [Actinosynnema pretiosum]